MSMLFFAFLAAGLSAHEVQAATTDAGVHRSSLLLKSGRLPSAEEVRVYDFVNYHRHEELPEPAGGARTALDARLLEGTLPPGPANAFLQVGIRTVSPSRVRDAKPVNLCLVIDRSGSMGDAKKMEYLKRGLSVFAEALNEGDILSIVTFDTRAEVVRAASAVSDPDEVVQLIQGIRPGGSTNLHAGLMLGYREVRKNLRLPKSPKVILLSDGRANAGVVDLEAIVEASRKENARGIALSTIGLGLSYNDRLMSQLAEAGRGTYHFLDSAEGIERTFLVELNSLLQKVATDPVVRVRFCPGVRPRRVFGYALRKTGPEEYSFRLLDLPLGLTQIIPMELEIGPRIGRIAEIRLDFTDVASKEARTLAAEVTVERKDVSGSPDPHVLKNRAIARLAQAFRDACELAGAEKRAEAAAVLMDALLDLEADFGSPGAIKDKDLLRIVTRVQSSLNLLKEMTQEDNR